MQLQASIGPIMSHRVPLRARWFYVFGSATLTCFLMQILTGILLALVYVPSAGEAYQSLEHLNYVQPLGWYIRALHGFFGNAMVFMLLCHLVQVVIFAAYKYPRELTWVFGCILFLCVLAMAFTGQVLRWDQDAYWGIGIGASMVGRIPLLGPYAVHMMLGGPIIGGETLTRFFALHVFVLPLTIAGTIFIHVMLVLKNGISDPPKAGTLVNPKTEREDYEKRIAGDEGTTFFPTPIARDAIFSGGLVIVVGILAAIFGPTGPNGIPDPTIIDTAPAPDIWFMSIFSSLALLPPSIETFLILTAPVVLVVALFAVPFFSNSGERHISKRPVAALLLVFIFMVYSVLTWIGYQAPWSPKMQAWSSDETPFVYVQGRTPIELAGAVTFQFKQCRNCHELGGIGGRRGPELDSIATRKTTNELIRQAIQGGGNMPTYGHNLSPEELAAIVAFLSTLHPENESPARTADKTLNP
ncbi:MAG: cytochrome b N-terminal domain-containing protein [Phycisphaerales bacterium]|nr:cytochrome b N-terminal domain-containing protein [Phycisphaerales bacterium]